MSTSPGLPFVDWAEPPCARAGQRDGISRINTHCGMWRARRLAEAGTGLLTSGIVATLLLLLLLLASQTLLLLYRSSLAEAAAFDAASSLATKGGRSQDVDTRTKELLGSTAIGTVVSDGDPVVVQVSLPSPGLLKFGPGSTKHIVRTAKVRREVFRPGGAPP